MLQDIADYVHSYEIKSDTAFQTARLCLMDSLGCHMEALRFPGARADFMDWVERDERYPFPPVSISGERG